MRFVVGDLVDLAVFPEDENGRLAEITKRSNHWPGWTEDMTNYVLMSPTGWRIHKIRTTERPCYEIINVTTNTINPRIWSEVWLVPTNREPYTVGQMLRALSR